MAGSTRCPNCDAELPQEATSCASCGRVVDPPTVEWAAPAADQSTGRTALKALALIMVVVIVIAPLAFMLWYGLYYEGDPAPADTLGPATPSDIAAATDRAAPSREVGQATTWTAPAGYEMTTEPPGLAYRWLADEEFDCEITEICWGMSVIPHAGCPNGLYVELAILDATGAQLSFTNDLVSAVRPDEAATLVFENTEFGPHDVRLSKVECL